jgi:hypothetical protein
MWLSYPSLGVHKTIKYLYPKQLNGECYFSFAGEPLVALGSKPPFLQPARFDSDDFAQT